MAMDTILWPVIWVVCGLLTIVGAVLAPRSSRGRLLGRLGVGAQFTIGGALVHAVNLATGESYAGFADDAHFAYVTDTWRSLVAPNTGVFIGLLVAFEAIVGVLALSRGRWTQLGYVLAIAFYLALWVFGWFTTVWVLVILGPMLVLLRAERAAEGDVATGSRRLPGRPVARHA